MQSVIEDNSRRALRWKGRTHFSKNSMEIDYTKEPECTKKITLSQYSDSIAPINTIKLKCTKDKGHEGEHEGLIWSTSEGIGKTFKVTWTSKFK